MKEYDYSIETLPLFTDPKTYEDLIKQKARDGWKLHTVKYDHKFTEITKDAQFLHQCDLLIFEKEFTLDVP